MKKTRIIYIEANRDGTIGGSYYSLLFLIEGLNKEKYEPIVIFYQDNPLIEKFKEHTKNVIVLDHCSPSDGKIDSLLEFLKFGPRFVRDILFGHLGLVKLIKQYQPDIVHLNNSYAVNHDWVLACKRCKVKIVAHDRGTKPPVTFQTKLFSRYFDAIICVSKTYLNYVTEQQLKPKYKCCVYNGLDIEKFRSASDRKMRSVIRAEYDVKDNDKLIGIVGNIDYWKGQLVLLKAFNKVSKIKPHVKLLIVGKTVSGGEGYEADIRSYIREHNLDNKVFLTGYREDIPNVLNALDIFVHASVEPEPFGRVIIEAMAMEKPVVATNSGGPTEIINNNQSGLLVPMKDEEQMADAILRIINSSQLSMDLGKNAYHRVKSTFTVRNMVDGVESVYKRIYK